MGFTRFSIITALIVWIPSAAVAVVQTPAVTNFANAAYEFAANVTEFTEGVGQDLGQAFTTGSSATFLQALTIRMGEVEWAGQGFTMSLYSDDGSTSLPMSSLPVTFTGDTTPIGAGDYVYTANSPFPLAPNTTYWAVMSVPHDRSFSQFYVAQTTDPSESGLPGWSIGNAVAVRTTIFGDALPWFDNEGYSLYLRVDAIPVPEPAALAAALSFGTAVVVRRRSR